MSHNWYENHLAESIRKHPPCPTCGTTLREGICRYCTRLTGVPVKRYEDAEFEDELVTMFVRLRAETLPITPDPLTAGWHEHTQTPPTEPQKPRSVILRQPKGRASLSVLQMLCVGIFVGALYGFLLGLAMAATR